MSPSFTNLLLRTMREQGFKPAAVLFVGTGDTPETLEAMGSYMEGILVTGYPRNDALLAPDATERRAHNAGYPWGTAAKTRTRRAEDAQSRTAARYRERVAQRNNRRDH